MSAFAPLFLNTYIIVFIFVCLAVPTFTSGWAKFFYTRFYILNISNNWGSFTSERGRENQNHFLIFQLDNKAWKILTRTLVHAQ